MSGITAAQRLRKAGLHPIILDKGRAPGGRMATRTIGGALFDHGAQHFGVRTQSFGHAVELLGTAGIVQNWFDAGLAQQPNLRYVGTSGMRSVVEHLARNLDIRSSVEVDQIERTDRGVRAVANSQVLAEGSAAIVTPPVPQLLGILNRGSVPIPPDVLAQLEDIQYNATLAVMAHLSAPADLPDGHRSFDSGPIAWIADNQHKGVSPVPAVTIHSTPSFAAEHLDTDAADWSQILVDHAAPHLAGTISDATGHRWRYSEPQHTLDVGAVVLDDAAPVILAGEIFAGAKVEGAYQSGLAAANMLLELL
jgi:predicted NAD/FAD-dependent oxidoreductase